MKSLLTVEQLSQYLHKSVASIRSDATRNPQSLPPICRLPGTKRLLWRLEDVEQWLAAHVEGLSRPAVSVFSDEPQPRRGRPTKAEQVARQRTLHRKRASVYSIEATAEV
ncbi:DNA-binding protein [Trinickia terrae]|uniref:DNA-binding protein n=1 Tax=Trinickia terrae TaxID=2571161 RepID=A0A4U1I7E0_9BURK|nr:DNA-binding protein [Trinickia terrae]TKC89332.1 DNA-binding protein [Trinickia terrae]